MYNKPHILYWKWNNDLLDKEILREQRTNSNNINPMSFNNIEGREYDYNDLEKKLLGWDS